MIIYHAASCEEDFILWGETPEDQAVPVSQRSGGRASASEAMPFPYGAGIKQLEAGFEGTHSIGGMKAPAAPAGVASEPALPGEPLPEDPAAFWLGTPVPDDLYGEVQIPQVHASLPKRLGNFPFWRGNSMLIDTLEHVYAAASSTGLEAFLPADAKESGQRSRVSER